MVVSGWQTKFIVSPGPGLWSLVLAPFGPDLGPGPELDNFKKSALEPLKIKIFRATTISPTYLGINLGIYDQKVQIWRGVKKDK